MNTRLNKRIITLLLGIIAGIFYIYFQVYTIYGGDSGDLSTAVLTKGIAHPPGYPLFTLLGILSNSLIQFGTHAWRIAFVSTIPAAVTVLLFFFFSLTSTKKFLASLVGSLVLMVIYPIWLYSVIVEVFALNNLFTIALFTLTYFYYRYRKTSYLYASCFIFGLSLTHHHIILFLVPTLAYFVYQQRKILTFRSSIKMCIFFLLGLMPYVYVLIAAKDSPYLNWLGSPTLSNLMKLITRAEYGTFQAMAVTAEDPSNRWFNVIALLDFIRQDFKIFGLVLIIIGGIRYFYTSRTLVTGIVIALLSYTFFIFYAAFPLWNNFALATFERFIQPVYIFLLMLLVFGCAVCINGIESLLKKYVHTLPLYPTVHIISLTLLLYPLGMFMRNYTKISILKYDFTAEKLSTDMLSNIPKNSILLLQGDTNLFNTEYVYFSQDKWEDIKLINTSSIYNKERLTAYQKEYPDLIIKDSEDPLTAFVENNKKFPIYSDTPLNSSSFVPYGLMYSYTENASSNSAKVLKANKEVWSKITDPHTGSLGSYKNLLLADVSDWYGTQQRAGALYALQLNDMEFAEELLKRSYVLDNSNIDTFLLMAQLYIRKGNCTKANDSLHSAEEVNPHEKNIYLIYSLNYKECFKDEKKSLEYQKIYEQKSKDKETTIETL